MNTQQNYKNVITMAQTEKKAKIFRRDYSVSKELEEEMVSCVFREFMIFALENYYNEENLVMLKEFTEEHQLKSKKREDLLQNLFWWQIMHKYPLHSKSCIDEFLTEKIISYRNKPFMRSWLKECDKVVSKFYYIGERYDNKFYVAIDILEEKPILVLVYDPTSKPLKQGEIVAGTLIPLGGSIYFPIIDFYHFDYEAREAMGSCLHHHYEKYLKIFTTHEAFIHVLSVMLQIERKIFLENQLKNHSTF